MNLRIDNSDFFYLLAASSLWTFNIQNKKTFQENLEGTL